MIALGYDPGIASPGIALVREEGGRVVSVDLIEIGRSTNILRTLIGLSKQSLDVVATEQQMSRHLIEQVGWLEFLAASRDCCFQVLSPFSSISKEIYKTTSTTSQRHHSKKRGLLALDFLGIKPQVKVSSDDVDALLIALRGLVALKEGNPNSVKEIARLLDFSTTTISKCKY